MLNIFQFHPVGFDNAKRDIAYLPDCWLNSGPLDLLIFLVVSDILGTSVELQCHLHHRGKPKSGDTSGMCLKSGVKAS